MYTYTFSFTIACVLFLQFSSQNGVKSFVRAFLLMIYLIGILEDPTFWGKVDDFGIILT